MRNTQPLTVLDVESCKIAWAVLTQGACHLDTSEADQQGSQTRFDPVSNCVFLGADVTPSGSIYSAVDELSFVAGLAHEFTHFQRSGSTLQNYYLEEVAVHVQSAEIPGLALEDRCALLRCAEETLMNYRIKECND